MIIVIGGIVTYFISGTITKSIIAVTKRMNELSELQFTIYGDEDAIKYLNRQDEIGSMARALRKMRDNIAEFIVKTDESTQQIVAISEELTATSQQSATVSEKIAYFIEVTNTVIEKINNSTEKMNKNKEKLMNLMGNLSAIAEEN